MNSAWTGDVPVDLLAIMAAAFESALAGESAALAEVARLRDYLLKEYGDLQ